MKRKFGELSPWPSAPELTPNAELDSSLPEHWPLWARLKNNQQLLQPTTDDVEFLIHGFHEVHPWLNGELESSFEEDRYQRFCLSFDGYWWSNQRYPSAEVNSVVLLSAIARRVKLIGGSTIDGDLMAQDARTRLATYCSLTEIRAAMFSFQRAHRHCYLGMGPSLLSAYPLLREMAHALLEMLRKGRTEFWDEFPEPDNS